MRNYLEFENEIKTLEDELSRLKDPFHKEGLSEVDTESIEKIQNQINFKLQNIYSDLTPWQKTLVARHEERPKSKFYIENLFTNFIKLSGDRLYSEDEAVLCGFALFEGRSVLVIGQEKGDDLESRMKRNFGMMRPEGYRKCVRLMKLANKFNVPIISFIDTPGAYPGMGAEQRGQSEAIAESIECSISLEVPNISIIVGEGGSGGAVALASTNKVLILENSIYSVISPEGCASILWKDPSKSQLAAKVMKISSTDLLKHKIVDEIVPEPLGGAHRDKDEAINFLRIALRKNIESLATMSKSEILSQRKNRFLSIGRETKFTSLIGDKSENKIFNQFKDLRNKKLFLPVSFGVVVLFFLFFYFFIN